jgi:hypothetical protein
LCAEANTWSDDVNGRSSKVIAGSFALAAFAVAVLSGLFSDNPASAVLGRALASMAVCYPVGLMVGILCERVVTAHVEAHRQLNPPPKESASLAPPDSAVGQGENVIVV